MHDIQEWIIWPNCKQRTGFKLLKYFLRSFYYIHHCIMNLGMLLKVKLILHVLRKTIGLWISDSDTESSDLVVMLHHQSRVQTSIWNELTEVKLRYFSLQLI